MESKDWAQIMGECVELVKRLGKANDDCELVILDDGLDAELDRVSALLKLWS